ncbi:MAG TPA: GntR family transcriptional regulator, partial [Streptosporangiaceae bacterium]|nr:GntR family transcriptional regulator [Streptosporangiaceae bacterium]
MADPMYVQIADDLRMKIETGELARGSKLQPEAVLQDEYSKRADFSPGRVSRNTIQAAVQLLARSGLVEKRRGQGTFVVDRIVPLITTLSGDPDGGETASYRSQVAQCGRERDESIPRVEIQKSSKAPQLKLREGEQVISRHQERRIDGKPYSLQTSFYPFSYVEKAPRLAVAGEISEGAVAYIQKCLGIKQAGWRDVLQVRAANSGEIDFFGFPAKGGGQVI